MGYGFWVMGKGRSWILGPGSWMFVLWFAITSVRAGEVVVYTALDREFSEPIFKQFTAKSGIEVRPVFDSESVKTVGLVNRLLAEKARPRCDVFWNNEIIRSVQLAEEGLVEPYTSPAAADIPAALKDPGGMWTGFGARARVLMVNTKLLPNKADWPRSTAELADAKWKGRCVVARPLFGTTNTHLAAHWAAVGPEKAQAFWSAAGANAILVSGNKQAANAVARGEAAWCLTDTDDAYVAQLEGSPVAMIYPEEELGGPGVMLIPNTAVLIKGAPNAENAKKLIDYIVSAEVEKTLSESSSAQIPVRPGLSAPKGLPELPKGRILQVDWKQSYKSLPEANTWAAKHFSQ